ncbi:MAG: histidine kinase [Bacteroidetes bacterium]|nr:histidine kinase [Bacteroidota bacterium]
MRARIRDILIVSSLYDLYLFEEDGRLYELIRNEYQGLNLSHSPELTRVSSGHEAISLAKRESRFDLIITTLHIEDMDAIQLAKLAREADLDIPIVLLSFDNRELQHILLRQNISIFENIFIWQGDFRIIIAMIKCLEDKLNVANDTKIAGVQVIIVIEDSVRYYSSFLPLIYTEMLKQSQRLISEGINLSHKFLRMRARPKILLCHTYEEALEAYKAHEEFILGIISDVNFKKDGVANPKAGVEFAEMVKQNHADIPILLQSYLPENADAARQIGASFIVKNSPTLLNELRQFMFQYFSFGDFVFRTPDGSEVGRAADLHSLEEQLRLAPDDSIRYHAERNHFSNWLKARTEFWLAHRLRPRKVSDYASIKDLRDDLINSIHHYVMIRQRGIITDFRKDSFDPESSFARIGGGSLGGKARGLGFVNTLISNYRVRDRFDGIHIYVPAAVVLGTEVFDQFIDDNQLRHFATNCTDDREITSRFLQADKFPGEILGELSGFLDIVHAPLAVRSSSLLEDSQYHPFAGVYETYMIPNNHPNALVRLNDLLESIKKVYASTFYQSAKDYIKVTSYRLEEEKMAVIVQTMVGAPHGNRFYPDISGVAKSYNFYPVSPQKSTDGIVAVALGLGKTIVDGGNTVRFCPKYPTDAVHFSIDDILENGQKDFYALHLDERRDSTFETHDTKIESFGLSVAEEDGTLGPVASTYSNDNEIINDGISRAGIRIVTFAPILKNRLFPLSKILELLLDMGQWGMGTPVEIEFAINMSTGPDEMKNFGLLQMRPLVLNREAEEIEIEEVSPDRVLCKSQRVLGNGVVHGVHDIVFVDYHSYDRSKSVDVAKEVSALNSRLLGEGRPYLLIGVGRWGSLDPWLGIPVTWDQIAGAKAIVETNLKDLHVKPSQGSHFFQNLTSFMVGYFTVDSNKENDTIDWDWLLHAPPLEKQSFTRLLRFDSPLTIKMNGQKNSGLILKPES